MTLPIITYHALGDKPSPLWTPPLVFEEHLAAFARCGYRSVTLATVVECLRRGAPLPENALVITFDDGYESVYRLAWPRLRSYGFGATIFLISDYCGRDNQWPGQLTSTPVAPLMSWEQVAVLAAEGCDFGAHTRTHPTLSALPLAAAEQEILNSQRCIQARTSQAVRSFAYPYGATNAAVTGIVRHAFDGAVGTELGMVSPGSHPYRLPRIDSYYLTPGLIPWMRSVCFPGYLRLRQALRSLRRRFYSDWRPTPSKDTPHA